MTSFEVCALVGEASVYFGLTLPRAGEVIKAVASVTAGWRESAKATGARAAEIARMASAFEHKDLQQALVL